MIMTKRLVLVIVTKTYYKTTTIEVEVDDNIVGEELQNYLTESDEVDELLEDGISRANFYDADSEYFYEDKVNGDGGHL